jgi:SAM-dependent methyltransferase
MLGKIRRVSGRIWQALLRKLLPYRYVWERDAEMSGWFCHTRRELLPGFAFSEQDVVADVGCGDGMATEFACGCGAEVYAIDVDTAAIEALQRRMQRQALGRGLHPVVSDCDPIPLPDSTATCVLAMDVMEHVDDPQRFLNELVRIGRPGARYLVTVPDPASEGVQRDLAPECYWRKPNHLRVFGREELADTVRSAGLTIEHRMHYSFFWSMWWALFWCDRGGFQFGAPATPVLKHWNKTWDALLRSPNGLHVRQALEHAMPKSQVLIARKAA